MNVNELRNNFIAFKQYEPEDGNELLDFAQQKYLKGEISIIEYKQLVRELELSGAQKPYFSILEEKA
jgi:hypothetical protein